MTRYRLVKPLTRDWGVLFTLSLGHTGIHETREVFLNRN